MRLRKLVRLCEHDQLKAHPIGQAIQRVPVVAFENCPGGEFLPEDATGLTAEMIEKALATPDRKWSRGTIMDAASAYRSLLVLDALAVRDGAE